MSDFTNAKEDLVLNTMRGISDTAPAGMYLALFSVAPGEAGGGTEIATGGYARKAVTFGAPSAGQIANTAAVDFVATGAAWTVVAVALMTALTGGTMWSKKTIATQNIPDGDTLRFDIGDLTFTVD